MREPRWATRGRCWASLTMPHVVPRSLVHRALRFTVSAVDDVYRLCCHQQEKLADEGQNHQRQPHPGRDREQAELHDGAADAIHGIRASDVHVDEPAGHQNAHDHHHDAIQRVAVALGRRMPPHIADDQQGERCGRDVESLLREKCVTELGRAVLIEHRNTQDERSDDCGHDEQLDDQHEYPREK